MEYEALMYRDLTAFTKGMNDMSRLGWALHSWRQSPTGALYIAVYQRLPGPAKQPAVAAKVIPMNHTEACWRPTLEPEGAFLKVVPGILEHIPGGCVSVPDQIVNSRKMVKCDGHDIPHAQNEACENPVPISGSVVPETDTLDWSACFICDPGHAAAQHLCERHFKEQRLGQNTADQMEKLLESRPWDGGPVHVNSHGRD